MIHGNDWLVGPMSNVRRNVIKELKKYGGKLIEVPYTKKQLEKLMKQQPAFQ